MRDVPILRCPDVPIDFDFHSFPQDFQLSHRKSTDNPGDSLEPEGQSVDSLINANVRYPQDPQNESISDNRQAHSEEPCLPA
jgi:hypothetical protein